jgi:Zn-dependent M28 family amino/carboxypeptidase
MGWWRQVRARFAPQRDSEAAAAFAAARRSHDEAVGRRQAMTALREQADEVTAEIRAHNVSNHFDTWLQDVIRNNMR